VPAELGWGSVEDIAVQFGDEWVPVRGTVHPFVLHRPNGRFFCWDARVIFREEDRGRFADALTREDPVTVRHNGRESVAYITDFEGSSRRATLEGMGRVPE